ncbi:hypothetical protein BDR26DRAFT_872227 [Obelidium mucronatum]|nr:hypothetical protein BDR26DRAFT_872227 [Obelidium mucronatum]
MNKDLPARKTFEIFLSKRVEIKMPSAPEATELANPDPPARPWIPDFLHHKHKEKHDDCIGLLALILFAGAISLILLGITRTETIPNSSKTPQLLTTSTTRFFGQHLSRGFAALAFAKGPFGTFQRVSQLTYRFNYYPQWATSAHPYNFNAVLYDGTKPPVISTCRDGQGILFADFDQNGELDYSGSSPPSSSNNNKPAPPEDAFAFVEHVGVNENLYQGTPFYHAWYDDNYVARIAMRAYRSSEPWGLFESSVKSRFVVLEGDTTYNPYPLALVDPAQYPDQISLHALYFANIKEWETVFAAFYALVSKSDAVWNKATWRFDYRGIKDFYHLCQMKMVFQRLLDSGWLKDNPSELSLVVQHVASLHSHILSLQIVSSGTGVFASWKTGVEKGDGSVINTETTVLAMLALGAGALWTFEPMEAPFSPMPGFVQYPQTLPNVLCARTAQRVTIGSGLVAAGPFVQMPVGNYTANFNVRLAAKPETISNATILSIQIFDGVSSLASNQFGMDSVVNRYFENGWTRLRVPFTITTVANLMEIRLYWHGVIDMDFGTLSIS